MRVWPVSYPDEDDVKNLLRPFKQEIMDLHQRAWGRWMASPDRATIHYQRTMTSNLFDYISQEASKVLDPLEGVRRIPHTNSVRYLFNNRLLMRFKHGNGTGLGRNIATRTNDEFINAEVDLLGLPGVWKIEALWYTNLLQTKIDRIVITARDGNAKIWCYALGEESEIDLLPTPLPIIPIKPAGTGLVTMKDVAKKIEKKDDQ